MVTAEQEAPVTETEIPVEFVSIPRDNAQWLLRLLDSVRFEGAYAKQQAATVQANLEALFKE